jgi:hypothetical protein
MQTAAALESNTRYKQLKYLKEDALPPQIRIFFLKHLEEALRKKGFLNISVRKYTLSSVLTEKKNHKYHVTLMGSASGNPSSRLTLCPVIYKYCEDYGTFLKFYSTIKCLCAVFIKGSENEWEIVQEVPSAEDKEFAMACYEAAEATKRDCPEVTKTQQLFPVEK